MMQKIIQATIAVILAWTILMLPVFGILMFKADYPKTGMILILLGISIWMTIALAIIHEIILKK